MLLKNLVMINQHLIIIFKDKPKYERVCKVDENIHDADDKAFEDIKTFADSLCYIKHLVIRKVKSF
jgi:hypothetical protein